MPPNATLRHMHVIHRHRRNRHLTAPPTTASSTTDRTRDRTTARSARSARSPDTPTQYIIHSAASPTQTVTHFYEHRRIPAAAVTP